jgi:hypothetical protein
VPTGLRRHDCNYIARRHALIPAAVSFADALVPEEERGKQKWSKLFSKRMAELMREPETGEQGFNGAQQKGGSA